MDSTDAELAAALDELTFNPVDDADLVRAAADFEKFLNDPFQSAQRRLETAMDGDTGWRDLYDIIVDALPLEKWPDTHLSVFLGMTDLTYTNRYRMITLCWTNGVDPKLMIRWFWYMGMNNKKRQEEMERIIKDLDEKARTDDPILREWRGFCMDSKKMMPLRAPSDEYKLLGRTQMF
jgi:hypothetical protein